MHGGGCRGTHKDWQAPAKGYSYEVKGGGHTAQHFS